MYKDKKRRKKKPQKQRQKGSNKSCGCFNSSIQMARTLAEDLNGRYLIYSDGKDSGRCLIYSEGKDTSRKFEITGQQ